MMTRDAVLEGVRECLTSALDVDQQSLVEEAKLIEDLGADSLDLLDLTFQLEQRFSIRISPRDIERQAREKLNGAPLEIDGLYTPEALAELRRAMPEVPADELADGLTQGQLPQRFRVATMVNLVHRLIEEQHSRDGQVDADG